MNWRFVFGHVRRALLPIWFLSYSVSVTAFLLRAGDVGGDFRIYYRATKLWLSGGDPWSAWISPFGPQLHFGAPPASLFPLAPFTLIGEDEATALSVILCALAAVYIVRRLHLGPAWLLFPPLVVGVLCGNPSVPLLALLLLGGSWAAALAVALKVYAVVPLLAERRWRAVAAAAVLFAIMVALAPGLWIEYAQRFGEISSRLNIEAEGGWGALRWWPLIPPTLLALAVIARYDLRAAGWMAVPVLWPGSEWQWSTFFLPVINPWLGVITATDVRGATAVAVWAYAIVIVWHQLSTGEPEIDARDEPHIEAAIRPPQHLS